MDRRGGERFPVSPLRLAKEVVKKESVVSSVWSAVICWPLRSGTTYAWPVDVSGNSPGFVSPIDALLVVNEINSRQFSDASGRLPKRVDGTSSLPFWTCLATDSSRHLMPYLLLTTSILSAVDGAAVQPRRAEFFPARLAHHSLSKGTDFVSQWSKPLLVPDDISSLEVLIESPKFDTTSQGTIRDAF